MYKTCSTYLESQQLHKAGQLALRLRCAEKAACTATLGGAAVGISITSTSSDNDVTATMLCVTLSVVHYP